MRAYRRTLKKSADFRYLKPVSVLNVTQLREVIKTVHMFLLTITESVMTNVALDIDFSTVQDINNGGKGKFYSSEGQKSYFNVEI